MFILESYTLAVLFLVIVMLCWGSWPVTQKLTKDWRFELFYWDYVLGILLLTLIFGLTLGSTGETGRAFLPDLKQAGNSNIISAILGGAIFNLANFLFVAAIVYAGMSVAFPVGGGIALSLGVLLSYMSDPKGEPLLLFGGVAFVVIAIILSAASYSKMSKVQQKVSWKGILLAVLGGIGFAIFYPLLGNTMISDATNPETGKMTAYTAVFIFAIGILLSNFIINTFIMRRPFEGEAVSFGDYFKGTKRNHLMGILGGVIWGLGISLSLMKDRLSYFVGTFTGQRHDRRDLGSFYLERI